MKMVLVVVVRIVTCLSQERAEGGTHRMGVLQKKLMMRAVEVRKEVPTVEEEREESRGEAMGKDG